MAQGFEVMVSSIQALNASIRGLADDMRRDLDRQAQYAPQGGDLFRRARDSVSRQYNHGAGRTDQQSIYRSIGQVAHQFARQTYNQAFGGQQQSQQPPPPQGPAFQQQVPPYNPMVGYVFGPQMPFGGGGGGGGGQQFQSGGPHQTRVNPWFQGPQGGGGGGGGGHHGPHHSSSHYGGGGWTNMLLGGARRLPYVGTGMAVTAAGVNIYQSEREKNRYYQGMEGGSNAAGFGERLSEETFRWSRGAVMPGDMARRAFKGVTSMGYTGKSQTGQGRQDALDFVSQNYKNRGMDVEESLGFVQTASKDANVALGELSTALKEVSDTAGKAGVNAKFMRQNFQGMLGEAIKTGAGPGSADIAGIFSSTQASYGREFQGSDMRGQLDQGYQYMIGAQYGVSAGKLQGIMRNQPGQYARMVAGSQRQAIEMILMPEKIRQIEDLIKKYGTSQQAIPAIEQEFLNNNPDVDLNVVAQSLSGGLTGVQLDNSNVMDWIIQQLAGNTAAAHTQGVSGKPVAAGNTAGATTGKQGLYTPSRDDTSQSGMKGVESGLSHINAGKGLFGPNENKAGQTYVDQMNKSGKRDPVLEALLQNVQDPNDTKVKVATAKGDRIMSFAEAMKLFPNEMAAGKVQIVTGDQAGRSTSDIVGGNVDSSRDYRGELTNQAGQKAGQSVQDYEKEHGKIKKAGGGDVVGQRVTVDLSTEAKKLLQLMPSTNNESQSTGYPPFNPNAQQGSRTGD